MAVLLSLYYRSAPLCLAFVASVQHFHWDQRMVGITETMDSLDGTPINIWVMAICMESGGLHAYMEGIITIHHR